MKKNIPATLRQSSVMQALSGEASHIPPIWMMRQAGRYLPEYRELRKKFPSFVDFCMTPDAVAEATLQPIRRFDLDAAIIFSDILTVPLALGCDVTFVKDSGPVVAMPKDDALIADFTALESVYEGIRVTRQALPSGKPLLGFLGLPWTLLLYMYAVPGEKEFVTARRRAAADVENAALHVQTLTDACIEHAKRQIDAGADAIQLFESWAAHAPVALRDVYCLEPARKITAAIRDYAPHVPVIWFVKGWGDFVARQAERVKPDCLGVDYITPLKAVADATSLPMQGNFDPFLLFAQDETIVQEVKSCVETMRGRPYIFNLGHGILPQTQISKVELLIATLRESAS